MKPGVYNIRPQRRADYVLNLVIKDSTGTAVDLTGYEVLAQVWDKKRTTKYGDFDISIDAPEDGSVRMVLPYAVTTDLPDEARYDVMLINPDGLREYYLEGIVRPSEGFTAPSAP